LQQIDLSDPAQSAELLTLVYDQLRAIAGAQLARERPGHTLQPTALVNEAYLRLVGNANLKLENRSHFFRIAARAMRQVLVDAARQRGAEKRGGDLPPVTLEPELVAGIPASIEFLELHSALDRLHTLEPRLASLVELRFFTGLTLDEAADALGVSRRTAAKDWAAARLWLQRELTT
jgi:RNA polymerase sigma factor (TIGR02999 family)